MAVFPLLADPRGYVACETDLLADARARAHWLESFAEQFEVHLEAAAALGVPSAVCSRARDELRCHLGDLRSRPALHGRLDILLLDELRDSVLRRAGIDDAFRAIKARENDAALGHLGEHLAALDARPGPERLLHLVRSLLAGNLFDMGAAATSREFGAGPVPFQRSLSRVPQRPWLIDDLDAANDAWLRSPPARAVIFVDNAGADVVLGALPLARAMLARGSEVVLAANSLPSLNDVTFPELVSLLARAAAVEPAFASPRLRPLASGNAAPLIDLRNVSPALAETAAGADLLVLLGMGRAIESNRRARFTCPTWKVAMIKDTQVAKDLGGKVFDAVFKYEA